VAGIVIKAGRVIDPSQGIDKVTDVVIDRGRIQALAKVGKDSLANYATILDASGCVVCPGMIDLHTHLREPGQEHKETIATGSRAAIAGGFTGVACMPNTEPPLDDASRVRRVIEKAEQVGFPVWPIAAVSLGRAGKTMVEMAEIVEAGAVAFSDDGAPVYDAHLMRSVLEYARMLEVPIVQHAEDTSLTVMGCMHEGRAAALLGVRGMPGIAEDVVVARDILLAEYTGGHVHIAHLSTAASLDMVRKAKKRGVRVTCEVSPHHLTLTDQDVHTSGLDPNWKMSPPLRSARDIKALRKGLKDGTVDFIATDHAPHHLDDKDTPFEEAAFGIVGLETALAIVLTDLVLPGVIDLAGAVALMSTRPAEVFNLPVRTLAPGTPANITIFDPEAEWTVDPEQFKSKGRNTPWIGRTLQGRAIGVVVEGKAYFSSDS
jgi:dihydroorotase